MTTDIHIKHPLRRRGLSQSERIAKALLPGEFRLDERSIQDLITAAYDYARFMRFYTPEGRPEGDWRPFWEVENLTYLAVLAALDTDQMRKTYEDTDLRLSEVLGAPKTAENDAKVLALFQQLMVTLRDMAAKLEQHYRTLRPEIPIKSLILNRIKRDYKNDPEELERPMQRLIRYHKGADDHLSYRDYEVFFAGSQYNTDNRWGIEDRDFYDQLLTNPDFDREKLRALFLGFFDTFRVVKAQAQRLFDDELANIQLEETETEQRPLQPHVALFFTFLQLFRHAQESLNEVPKRHLDFYYEQVLGFERNKEGVPDHAYLIFTLAKEFSGELLEKGTQLLGGKDKNGQPLLYETLEQWRVTLAQVSEVKNTHIGRKAIRAASVISDGKPPKAAFRAFGDSSAVPAGSLGFAIASPQLLLREGDRTINIEMVLKGPVRNANEFNPADIHIRYSSGEKMEELPNLSKGGNPKLDNGFILSPQVSPFLPIQTVEPARRIVSDLISDLCLLRSDIPPIADITIKIPVFPDIKNIHDQITAQNPFLNDNLLKPALSGIYYAKKFMQDELERAEKDEDDPDNVVLGELKFYRAYYYWSLAKVFAPPYMDGEAGSDFDNLEEMTIIPNLIDHEWPTQPGTTFTYFNVGDLYNKIIEDLEGAASDLSDVTNISSKTSINYYTVVTFQSRVLLQMQKFSECKGICDDIINDSGYELAETLVSTTEGGEETVGIFDNINDSPEVIWAMETAQSGLNQSWFGILGYNDSFERRSDRSFFKASPFLSNVYLKDASIDIDDNNDPLEPESSELKKAKKAARAPVEPSDFTDMRVNHFFNLNEDDQTTLLSTKYFQKGQTKVVMFRLAEVYLNRAVCLFRLNPDTTNTGNIQTILADLNALRGRAGVPRLAIIGEAGKDVNVNLENLFEYIYQERIRELAFEGDRKDFVQALIPGNVNHIELPNAKFYTRTSTAEEPTDPGVDKRTFFFPFTLTADEIINLITKTPSVLALTIKLRNDATEVTPDKAMIGSHDGTKHPVLYVTFEGNQAAPGFYNFLKKQKLVNTRITVEVSNIRKNLVLQTDFGVFDGTQRIYPFGPVPENGAQFFVGCEEAFYKKLDATTVNFDWIEDEKIKDPDSADTFDNIYDNYGFADGLPNPEVSISLLDRANFETGPTTPISLLTDNRKRMRNLFPLENITLEREKEFEQFEKYDPTRRRGFLRFTLKGDFAHKDFPNAMTVGAIKESKKALADVDGSNLPKPPYTPSANNVSLYYKSAQEMEEGIDQFFHILPFEGFVA
ncbi:MAG TPA: RagB/SusD family nutrient uptake outer membrane protein, partial [Saprospiraceae bacterium]|nr:RagB/SusD family nutrient uptake outer membrane protein [Saprospiraceae bacterium]